MDLHPRKRLFRRLDGLRRGHPVPWIAAPAGSGKTSLLVSYVEEREIPCVWYRVDEGDRHAADLFYYVRAAVEARERDRRAAVELPSFTPAADAAQFARRLFEAVFARLPPGAMLVFDDFHLAPEDSAWQLAVEKALGCVPDGMNVVVLSRRAPPAALARPNVHGEIALLDAAELRLTEDETVALARRRRARPGRAELRRIHDRTGGWAAGVCLLLRSDAAGPETMSVDVDVQPVFDYLASAIFAPSTCWTDVDALEHLLSSSAAGDARPAADRLLSLYRGAFSEDDDLPPALAGFRERTRSRVAAALLSLGKRLGDAAAEESLYTRGLEADDRMTALLVPLVRCLAQRGHTRKARELLASWRAREDADAAPDLLEAEKLL
jgi:hypothetical protein